MEKLENLVFNGQQRKLSPTPIYLRNYKGCEAGGCEGVGSDYGGGCDRGGGCDSSDSGCDSSGSS